MPAPDAPDTTIVNTPAPDAAAPAPAPEPKVDAPAGGEPAPKVVNPAPAADPAKPAADQKPADAPKEGDEAKQVLPENWRDEFAKNEKGEVDAKLMTMLNRYKSPSEFARSHAEAQAKIRSGELKAKPLAADATDEQKTEYRKANGIPETPAGYLESVKDIVFGKEDQEAVNDYLKRQHDSNANPDTVANSLTMFHDLRDKKMAAQTEHDEQSRADSMSVLRTEFGPDYQRNMGAVDNFIKTYFPADVAKSFLEARLGDERNTPVMSSDKVIRALAGIALELNPSGTGTAPNGENRVGMIKDRLGSLYKEMGTKTWYADTDKQAEYRNLMDQFKKQTGKDWAPL